MDLIKIDEQNMKYFSKDFIKGFNTGASRQYLHDMKKKTGRWMWDSQKMAFICSCCGAVFNMGDDADAALDWPEEAHYCLSCGAGMEEKSEYI